MQLHKNRTNKKKGLLYLEKSLEKSKETKSNYLLFISYLSLGRIHMLLNDFDSCKKYFSLAEKISTELENPLRAGFSKYYLGTLFF